MDPIATILACILGTMPRRDARDALSGWYAKRGWRPSLFDIHTRAVFLNRHAELPRTWKAQARSLGAV